jgi:hypothetical protein
MKKRAYGAQCKILCLCVRCQKPVLNKGSYFETCSKTDLLAGCSALKRRRASNVIRGPATVSSICPMSVGEEM